MDDPSLDPIEETEKPVLSDSELSDVDEEAYAGIDTSRLGVQLDSDEEGPSVFSLKPAKLKTGTGERKKKRAEDSEERRRKRLARQERRQEKEEAKKRKARHVEDADEYPEAPDRNRRPEDPEEARRWELERAMDSAVSGKKKTVKRRRKDEEYVLSFVGCANLLGYSS